MLISSAGGNPIYRALLQLSTPIPRARVQSLAALALTLIIALMPRHSLAQPQPEPWSAVTSAAQREGRLTVYNGTGFRVVRLLADQFQRDYGIAVDVLDGRASEIRERGGIETVVRALRRRVNAHGTAEGTLHLL